MDLQLHTGFLHDDDQKQIPSPSEGTWRKENRNGVLHARTESGRNVSRASGHAAHVMTSEEEQGQASVCSLFTAEGFHLNRC